MQFIMFINYIMNHPLGFSLFTPSPSYAEITSTKQSGDTFQAAIDRMAAERGLVTAISPDMSMRQYFIHPRTKGVYYVEFDPYTKSQIPVFMVINSEEILRINGY